MARTSRTWAAVRGPDGVVRAEVRDFTVRAEWEAWTFGPDIRWWMVLAYDAGREDPLALDEHRHGRRCGPGSPCGYCQRRAEGWWVESARRRAAREAQQQVAAGQTVTP